MDTPVLALERVVITTTTSDAVSTARYLCYKATQLWPNAAAEDKYGNQCTHRGFKLPPSFNLLTSFEGGDTISVAIKPDRIELATKCESGRAVMELIAADPIWGATWLLPVTRYFAE